MTFKSNFPDSGSNHNRMFLLYVRTGSDECACLIVMCCVWRALQVPVTDYSFEDCQLAMAEAQIRLPVDTCLLEFAKLVRSLGWVSLSLQTLMRRISLQTLQHAEDDTETLLLFPTNLIFQFSFLYWNHFFYLMDFFHWIPFFQL